MVGVTSRRILAEIRELRLESREQQARANELMEAVRAELALNREERARAMDFYVEHRQVLQDQLRLTHEVIRRNELAFQQGTSLLAELVETVREMKEEVRAQTRAIFKLIDRLDGGAGPVPETG